MRIAIFGDLQIHNYKQHNTGTSRLDNCIQVLFDIGAYCRANDIKTVFFVGDIHDTFSVMLTVVVNKSVDAWLRFAETYPEITIYAITGNHDMGSKNLLNSPAITCLDYIERIIPNNFKNIDNKTFRIGESLYVSGIPYYEYKEHYAIQLQATVDRIAAIEPAPPVGAAKHYLLNHQTSKGIGNELIPFDTNPADPIYDNFAYTFCGHIHQRQQLTDRYYNVGSPLHRTEEDKGQKKGFIVLDTDTQVIEFVPLEGYPEFTEVMQGDEVPVEHVNDYVVVKPNLDVVKLSAKAKVEEFNTSLSNIQLMENYWKEVDGKDKARLSMGLSFLQ